MASDFIELEWRLGSDLSSRLIAWYGQAWGGWSHVDARLPNGDLAGARADAIGGKPPGFQIRPSGYEKAVRTCTMRLPCAAKQKQLWLAGIDRLVGAQYDTGNIIDFIIGRKPITNDGKWICSAAQTYLQQKIKLLPTLPVPPQQITPNSLMLIDAAIGGVVT